MVGLALAVVGGVLVCCASAVLVLCIRAPRVDDPAQELSRLDLLDGRDAGGHDTTPGWRVPDEPGRVA